MCEDRRSSLEDVVADNTSAAAFVIGPWQEPTVDLADRPVTLSIDDDPAATGSTRDILGNPTEALAAAKRMAAAHGHRLRAGDVLLAGAATAAVPLQASTTVRADVQGLGTVSLRTVGER